MYAKGTFYSTAGQPKFIPDANTPVDTNEFCPILLYQSTPSLIFDIGLILTGSITFSRKKKHHWLSRPAMVTMNKQVRIETILQKILLANFSSSPPKFCEEGLRGIRSTR